MTHRMKTVRTLLTRSLLLALPLTVAVSHAHAAPPEANGEKKPSWSFAGGISGLNEFCEKDANTDFCLRALYGYRCTQLSIPYPFIGNFCTIAGSLTVKLLNITRFESDIADRNTGEVKRYQIPVIFHEALDRLTTQKNIQNYLADLASALRKSVRDESPFSLYAFTRAKAGSDAEAVRWLALLLQDTSWVKNHFRYLTRNIESDGSGDVDPDFYRAMLDLYEVLTILDPDAIRKSRINRFIRLYPEAIGATELDLNPSIYHFYPMAYIAMLTRKSGVNVRLSAYTSFMFNTEYELRSFPSSRWPLRLPASFQNNPNDPAQTWRLQDIYGGYAGAQFGTGQIRSALSFKDFRIQFSKNPAGFLRNQLTGLL